MKILVLILTGLLSVSSYAEQPEASSPYQTAYRAGIEDFKRGEFDAASQSLFQAIKLAPGPEAGKNEYLPYIYLSATQFELGNTRNARDALIQSQVFGVAARTETGRLLLDRYATQIMSAPLDEPAFVSSSQPSPVASRSLALSEDEVESIRALVLECCASAAELADSKKLPWYFYYELGIELMKAGDAQRALDSFVLGANVLQDPKRGKRMYGMWFVDYLPYYQIALANAKLGNWENAQYAIKVSEGSGEFTSSDPGYEAFVRLDRLIASQLENKDS